MQTKMPGLLALHKAVSEGYSYGGQGTKPSTTLGKGALLGIQEPRDSASDDT